MTELISGNPDWSIEVEDPSVGIFGDAIIHQACPEEYEDGCTTPGYLSGTYIGEGLMREVVIKYIVTCCDCGASVLFDRTTYAPDYPEEVET